MKLIHQEYGKGKVRVMKVTRSGKWNELKEVDVTVMLSGDFGKSYTEGDNSKVVPTDTVKNTIHILAKTELGEDIEEFALALGSHFLKKYSQVSSVRIEISERLWSRMAFGDKLHDHSFVGSNQEYPFTKVVCARGKKPVVQSGMSDLVILKTTASGFENYPKCEFTTIPETNDRILGTSLNASWEYNSTPKSYSKANAVILEAMMKAFTKNYSPSLQKTLHEMAEAGFKAVKQVNKISLKAPNMHCLLVNFAPFGMENKNEIFVPTTEPHGQIEGDFER